MTISYSCMYRRIENTKREALHAWHVHELYNIHVISTVTSQWCLKLDDVDPRVVVGLNRFITYTGSPSFHNTS